MPRHLIRTRYLGSYSKTPLEEKVKLFKPPSGVQVQLIAFLCVVISSQNESSHKSRDDCLSTSHTITKALYINSNILMSVMPHTALTVTYLRDQRDDGLPSMATNNGNIDSSWI